MGPSMSTLLLFMSQIDNMPQPQPPTNNKRKAKKPRQDFQNKPYQYNSKNMRRNHNIKQPGYDVQRRKQ